MRFKLPLIPVHYALQRNDPKPTWPKVPTGLQSPIKLQASPDWASALMPGVSWNTSSPLKPWLTGLLCSLDNVTRTNLIYTLLHWILDIVCLRLHLFPLMFSLLFDPPENQTDVCLTCASSPLLPCSEPWLQKISHWQDGIWRSP